MLLGVGCASGPEHWGPQPDLPRPLAQQMDVELRVPTEEIGVAVAQGDAMAAGGGLIGVLVQSAVDGVRARGAEQRVAEIRNQLVGNDYREVSREAVETHLDRSLVAPDLAVTLSTQSVEQELAAGELADRRNVMVLEHTYYFDEHFSFVQVQLGASLGDRRIDRNRVREENMRFYNRYYYTVPLADLDNIPKREDRVAAWATGGPEVIDAAIRDGMRETIQMLNYDLAAAPEQAGTERTPARRAEIPVQVLEVKRDGDRMWGRERYSPFLHSLPTP